MKNETQKSQSKWNKNEHDAKSSEIVELNVLLYFAFVEDQLLLHKLGLVLFLHSYLAGEINLIINLGIELVKLPNECLNARSREESEKFQVIFYLFANSVKLAEWNHSYDDRNSDKN